MNLAETLTMLSRYKQQKWKNSVSLFQQKYSDKEIPMLPTSPYIMMKDEAAELLKQLPKCGVVYYWILYYNYLTEESPTISRILEQPAKENVIIGRSTYFKKKKKALELFGEILSGCQL